MALGRRQESGVRTPFVTELELPILPSDATNKQYVDSVTVGTTISTIDGNSIVMFPDASRSKTLSIETTEFNWNMNSVRKNNWISIGNAIGSNQNHNIPHNATIVKWTASAYNTDGNTKNIHLYINGTETSNYITFAATTTQQTIQDLVEDIDVSAGDEIRFKSDNSNSKIKNLVITMWLRWR